MRIWLLPLGIGLSLAPLIAADQPPPVANPPADLIQDAGGRTLFDLIQEGDRANVADFLEAHPESLNQRRPDLDYPLHDAITRGRWEIAQLLLDHDADVNGLNRRNETPLIQAAINNNAALVAALLEKNAKPDLQDTTGQTALHYAVRAANKEAIDSLLAHSASIDKVEKSKGLTPVHLALTLGRDDLAQMLVAAQLNEKTNPLFFWIHDNQPAPWQAELDAHPDLLDLRIAGGWSMLHQAVLDNRTDFINYLLDHGFDPLARDCGRRTALHIAARTGDVDLITRLIQKKSDPRAIDERGLAPLSLAIRNNNHAVAEVLLLNGGDPNILDTSGRTSAFDMAACDEAMAALLLRHNVHLNVRDPQNRTVLYSALNDPKRTALLIAGGATANLKDKAGMTPLHQAAANSPAEVVAQLIRAGVPLDERDNTKRTALHIAALNSNVAVARLLVESGCDVDAIDKTGTTPLHLAVYNVAVVGVLLQHHALVDPLDAKDHWTPLDIATRNADADTLALLKAHLDMLAAANKGDLAAMQAVYQTLTAQKADADKAGRAEAAKILGAAAGSVNTCRNRDGATPLMLAAAAGAKDIVAALIPAGADPSARDLSGATPFLRAAEKNQVAVMQLLLQKKVEPAAVDLKRQTALHKAAAQGAAQAVQILLAAGLDRDLKDADGHTALDLATANKHDDIVALLAPPAKGK
ncbi:MAG TPA: ankyrin repeat domain-containing protein [Planctomycetota bacterium]|nr:ankyrin repeat domain-containing protein [Planctomycetota bacterium]